MLALNAINAIAEWSATGALWYDKGKLDEHLAILGKAIEDLNKGLALGYIPKQYQNDKSLCAILNVILQGENLTGDAHIWDIGVKILRDISKKDNGLPLILEK